jgi:dUTPase
MTKDEILAKISRIFGADWFFSRLTFWQAATILGEEVPEYRFALREDIKDDLRFLPTRGEETATGWDVRACFPDKKELVIRDGQYVKIPLGFRAYCPEDWWLKIAPRSSSFVKKSLQALYGVIDETFEGEMQFCAKFDPDLRSLGQDLVIKHGDAIGQLIPVKRQEMKVSSVSNEEYDELCKVRNSVRGANGFGSTGA